MKFEYGVAYVDSEGETVYHRAGYSLKHAHDFMNVWEKAKGDSKPFFIVRREIPEWEKYEPKLFDHHNRYVVSVDDYFDSGKTRLIKAEYEDGSKLLIRLDDLRVVC